MFSWCTKSTFPTGTCLFCWNFNIEIKCFGLSSHSMSWELYFRFSLMCWASWPDYLFHDALWSSTPCPQQAAAVHPARCHLAGKTGPMRTMGERSTQTTISRKHCGRAGGCSSTSNRYETKHFGISKKILVKSFCILPFFVLIWDGGKKWNIKISLGTEMSISDQLSETGKQCWKNSSGKVLMINYRKDRESIEWS